MDILGVLKSIFYLWFYPEQNTEEGRKECKKVISRRAISMIVVAIIAFGLIFVSFIISTNLPEKILEIKVFEGNYLFKKGMTLSDLLISFFFIGVFLCFILFFYAMGVKKHWKLREESELVDVRYIQKLFNERYELDNRRCSECEKYSDTGKLIVKAMEGYTYSQFISFFKKATGLRPEELNLIREDFASEKRYAKLLCVLSNPAYYTPRENPSQLEQLTHYFISFYTYINDQKRIKRIFSLSAINNKSDNEETYKAKAKWLLEYLLINDITGVETCLLVDEEGLKIHVDYVVGKYPEGEYRLYSKRKSYFSYEVEDEKDKDYTIQCSDQLFTNILETDFYERWKGLKKDKRERERIHTRNSLNKKNGNSSWDRIIKLINLNEEDVLEVVNTLSIHINSCKDGYFTSEDRNTLFDELIKVIDDKSFTSIKNKRGELIKMIKKNKGSI